MENYNNNLNIKRLKKEEISKEKSVLPLQNIESRNSINQISIFENRLKEVLSPSLSAKELIEKIVKTALEVEFGPSFTLSKGFDKMVSTIADSMITNPELRQSALSIASIYIKKKEAK